MKMAAEMCRVELAFMSKMVYDKDATSKLGIFSIDDKTNYEDKMQLSNYQPDASTSII